MGRNDQESPVVPHPLGLLLAELLVLGIVVGRHQPDPMADEGFIQEDIAAAVGLERSSISKILNS